MQQAPQLNRPARPPIQPSAEPPVSNSSHTNGNASYIETLPIAECFELLAVATVGRIGFVSTTGLQIIPVNYRLGADNRIFLKVPPRGTLAQLAERGSHVTFEVDYHASDFRIAWSVLMQGTICRLDEAAEVVYAQLRRPPIPWPGSGSSLAVQFVLRTISGRGLHRALSE